MAKAITEVAIGAAAIGAAVLLPGAGIAAAAVLLHTTSAAIVGTLVSIGASAVMSGIADALKNNQGGLAVAVTTPVGPWGYVYGRQKVGGVEIFRQSNSSQGTSNNKELHRVYVLASHSCLLGSWQLRIDGRQVLMNTSGTGFASFTPSQIVITITSLSRDVNGLVTMVLSANLFNADGTELQIKNCPDNSFNGIWRVTQPNPANNTTFEFVNGGPVTTVSGGNCSTLFSDYKDKIYIEFLNGHHSATFPGLLASGTSWNAADKCLGKTLAYVRMGYDDGVFPSAIPNVSFIIDGKDDILDPRLGTRGYTNNAALCVADYLSLPTTKGGFGLTIGSEIPSAQLSAAANVCDEAVPLAAGGTIPRYTCNTFFQLNMARGSILQQMLSSCAGRISFQGGTYNIFPGHWPGPTLQLFPGDLIGPIKLAPRLSIRDTCNAVKGTYVSPENAYQMADVPPFMADYKHGYGLITDPGQGDAYLLEDNSERVFREANFPCTDNAATAQRLAKIALLRTRFQQRVTIRCTMKAYQCVALDVIQLTHPRYAWLDKDFEVLSSRLVLDRSGAAPTLAVELDIAETNSLIYNWATTEELSPQGFKQPHTIGGQVTQPPEFVSLYSGPGETVGGITYPSTVTTRADGTKTNSIYVLWTTPNDAYVTAGGHIEIQFRNYNTHLFNGGNFPWISTGKFDPSVNSTFLAPVSDGASYLVQIRAVNTLGVPSDWISVGPQQVSSVYSTLSYSGIPIAPAGTLSAQGMSDGTAQITVLGFTPPWGSPVTPSPNVITGLNQSQLYYVYYIDLSFTGGTKTPIATQNKADFENHEGYFLIGSIVTPSYAPRYQPSAFSDVGNSSTTNPTAAYDNDVTTDAIVRGTWSTVQTGTDPITHAPIFGTETGTGRCIYSGFPAVVTTAATTLKVIAAADFSGLSSPASAVARILVTVGGTVTNIAGFTASAASATYTLSIPSGTNLSTIQVAPEVVVSAGTPPGGGAATIEGFEIYIQ